MRHQAQLPAVAPKLFAFCCSRKDVLDRRRWVQWQCHSRHSFIWHHQSFLLFVAGGKVFVIAVAGSRGNATTNTASYGIVADFLLVHTALWCSLKLHRTASQLCTWVNICRSEPALCCRREDIPDRWRWFQRQCNTKHRFLWHHQSSHAPATKKLGFRAQKQQGCSAFS